MPVGEMLLALALLVTRGPLLIITTLGTLTLFGGYWFLIARAMRLDPRVSCACFGHLGGHAVDNYALVRNSVLVALSVVALGAPSRAPNSSPPLATSAQPS